MSIKTIVIFVAVTISLLLGMTLLLSVGNKPGQATESSPRALVAETEADLGTMKVTEEKSAEFTIKNEGKEPLKLSKLTSSCNCTFGQFVYQGQTSREYGMHAESGYLGEVGPGQMALVRVIYRPSIMPVSGPVERQVFVNTNDPLQPTITLNVRARVE